MRFLMRFWLMFLAGLGGLPFSLGAQMPGQVRSVNLDADVNEQDSAITLQWKNDTAATGWVVHKQKPGKRTWPVTLDTLPASQTQITDENAGIGKAWEYRVQKLSQSQVIGEGYLTSGIRIPPRHFKGGVALVMDHRLQDTLQAALNQFKKDLTGSGWQVVPLYVDTGSEPKAVKDTIQAVREAYGDALKTVCLVGQVPVPYAGNFGSRQIPSAPDGHQDHVGAWPADVYYATKGGAWTDITANNTQSRFPRNHNTLRDGNYDQSFLQQVRSKAQLQIGRIDLSNLPAFDKSEFALLERYFRKNHQYRYGNAQVQMKGIVQDNFQRSEGFSQNGFRNFSALLGKANVHTGDYQDHLTDSSYIWSYGAGAGNMDRAGGIVTTSDFARDTFNGVFTMLFGSYFGDFDGKNNLLRAALASKGQMLSASWAGRPHWHYHPMGMGVSLGRITQLTQNNALIPPMQQTPFLTGAFAGGVHVALMGDPTLTLYAFEPPTGLSTSVVKPTGNEDGDYGLVNMEWQASSKANGYFVYRYDTALKRYRVLNDNPVKQTSFRDTNASRDSHAYMVRAVRLKQSPSGSYYQLSQGVFDTAKNLSISGKPDPATSSEIKTFPNPATDQVRVRVPDALQNGVLQMLSVNGRVIKQKPLSQGRSQVTFSLANTPPGNYILRIEGDSQPGTNSKRLIVQ